MSIKTVFTSRIKRWGKRILNNSGLAQRVFRRIVMSDQASRILLNDNVALLDLVSHADFGKSPSHAILQQYLLEGILRDTSLHPRIAEWLGTQPHLLKSVLSGPQLARISDREPKYISALIKQHGLYEDLIERNILEKLFEYEETLDTILENYELRERLLFDERVIDRIAEDPRYQDYLFSNQEILQTLLDDSRMPDALLAQSETVKLLLAQPALAEIVSADTSVQEKLSEYLGLDVFLNRFALKDVVEHCGVQETLAQFDSKTTLNFLGNEQLIAHLGTDALFAALEPAEIMRRSNLRELLGEMDPLGGQLAAYLEEHPEVVRTLSLHEEIVKHFLSNYEFRENLRILHGIERASKLPYTRPAVVVSYPRSGSNFVQSILTHSSGMRNVSIYGEGPGSLDPLLTVKSHALSPAYLQDEFLRLLNMEDAPERIVLIKRDPRDVMISFYEYTQKQRDVEISQEEFLKDVCFFYASTIDKTNSRNIDKAPMNILDAYKKHIRAWFTDRPASLNVHEIAYEELVLHPLDQFRETLDYLDLNLPVAESFLDVKVSLYSDKRSKRGQAMGWRSSQEKYAVLLEGVHRLLADEIDSLGYGEITVASDVSDSNEDATGSKEHDSTDSSPKEEPK